MMMNRLCQARNRRAFTFIELTFIVVILAVTLVVVIPRLGGTAQSTAIDSTGRNFARLAEYARQMSIMTGKEVRMTIDQSKGAWWIDLPEREDDARFRRSSRERNPRTQEEVEYFLPERLKIREVLRDGQTVTRDEIVVRFYPTGSSTSVAVVLESLQGDVLTMEIEGATGRAMAYAGEPKSFAQRLEEMGLDPSRYGETPTGMASGRDDRPTFYRSAGSAEERVNHYQNAAQRIMNRVEEQQSARRETGGWSGM